MQRRIGLTGGIASGKSRVGRLLEAHGWPVLDADRYAREALAVGSDATRQVLKRWNNWCTLWCVNALSGSFRSCRTHPVWC